MYKFSQHFLDQMQLRNITLSEVEDVLYNEHETVMEDELMIHQKVIISNNRPFLIRVFVNDKKQPPVALTVYKTSKIDKYTKA